MVTSYFIKRFPSFFIYIIFGHYISFISIVFQQLEGKYYIPVIYSLFTFLKMLLIRSFTGRYFLTVSEKEMSNATVSRVLSADVPYLKYNAAFLTSVKIK